VRWGVLGAARINRQVIPGALAAENAEVVAIAAREEDRARAQADEYGIARVHSSYDDLLNDPEVEAVYIPLPNSLHVEWSERALEAGKHVLCEKPLGRRPDEVERAFDHAERAGLLLSEAFMYRHHQQTWRLQELIRSGAIGRLWLVRASFSFLLANPGDVRMQYGLDGGALMDVGCYCVSGARLLAGEPEMVGARQVVGGDGVDISLAGTLHFANGVLANIDCSFTVPHQHSLQAVGDEGTLVVRDPWHCADPGIELLREDAEPHYIHVQPEDPYQRELEDFSRAVREGGQPLLGREDAMGQARTIAALYESTEWGTAVAPKG
jgi:predicted dehydrogenase